MAICKRCKDVNNGAIAKIGGNKFIVCKNCGSIKKFITDEEYKELTKE